MAAVPLLVFAVPALAQMSPAPPPPPMMVTGMNWTGFYAGGNVGGDWSKFPGSVSVGATPAGALPGSAAIAGSTATLNNSFRGSPTIGGQFGYNWQLPSNWVLGGEIQFNGTNNERTTNLSSAFPFPTPNFIPGDTFKASSAWYGSARAKLGYAWGPVLPYVTGGVAFADVTLKSSFPSTTAGGFFFPSSTGKISDTLVGWTAGMGIDYSLTPSWSLGAEYRYADYGSTTGSLGKLTTLVSPAGAVTEPISGRVGVNSHSLEVKINYHFGAPPPPPPAPMAIPAPPPAAPKVFIVFFDWDKDLITPEGHAIIQQAADAYKMGAPVQIQVTGYTDRSGSPGYNQRLSERRANNVAKAMAAMGVPRGQMVVSGRGENDNRVPTAPGVREPQNRRVEIVSP
jgi:opacity protein-like surface antigen